ncbi:HD domain-containing protein [Leptolyngbya sp. FACHB-261]|uniref:HD domain-containing protein n=1 Tax=Leptolyngbya sp. FACHB-261 TaxID=2692806 RepID=UPI0016869E65|nr:HD domain-containing protein [Leptolyngbya sp. FACHB-261]MBD2100147.1 HD domain-containing protein [Leptolyngbya sp. FACHB-261]
MAPKRLAQQIEFIIEIDKLKQVLRQTLLTDESRRENSAEHSWHLAMMAILLAEYVPTSIDVLRVIKMLLIHDLVEIDAGDTFCYDSLGNQDKALRETQAATRLFGLLPPDQGTELHELWQEFEAQATPEAQFAAALDRLQPLLHNQQTRGGTWRLHGITQAQVLQRMSSIQTGAPALWPLVQQIIEDCIAAGYLQAEPALEPAIEPA